MKIDGWIGKHYIWAVILLTLLLSVIIDAFHQIIFHSSYHMHISEFVLLGIPHYMILIWPFVLTFAEIIILILTIRKRDIRHAGKLYDLFVFGWIFGYTIRFLFIEKEMDPSAGWQTQLHNSVRHAAIAPEYRLSVIVLLLAAIVGYFILNYVRMEKMSPLIGVLAIAAMYVGDVLAIIWTIQIWAGTDRFWLLFLPVNCLLITMRVILFKIKEWNEIHTVEDDMYLEATMNRFGHWLVKSEYWPLLALIVVWPLLGVLLVILMLFGQAPDAAIRAFTETADWNLSQRNAPENMQMVYNDMHYLCTVAAGGHEKVVRPQRLGIRHGHTVVVNRQLCVANAFEQILEERTPRFHKAVRHFYDTYGFPIAARIHSKYTADMIYLLMKPLEWAFLIVLYLADVHPEDRIALQYTGKSLSDFGKSL